MKNKVLVVAFDGMDKELIQKFDLGNIKQKEFGEIDNSTDISRRMTSELFVSFITGQTYEKHRLTGLGIDFSWRDKLIDYLIPQWALRNLRGVQWLREKLRSTIEESRKYKKSDINTKTLFDEIEASLPLYVPGYNPDTVWALGFPHKVTRYLSTDEWIKATRWHTEARLKYGVGNQPGFWNITRDFWDFIMLHLHDPDSFQDIGYGNLEEEYSRLNEIAGKILDEYGDNWTVIFMSDHGRPEEKRGPHEHNKSAFYSSNKELFGDQTPHITDFHDKILELVAS